MRGCEAVTVVDGVRLVSNSEIQSFKDCPRRWWLAWYRGLTPRAVSVEGVRSTGTRVHIALASLYVPDGETPANPLRTLETVILEDLAVFMGSFDGVPVDAERLKALQSQFDLERAMISGYVDWTAETGVDAYLEVVASEQYVEVDLEPPALATAVYGTPVKLIGKIDARVRSRITGRRKFIDHKTIGTLIDPVLGLNQQMLHYHVIEWLNTREGEERCDGALYNMLRKVKRTRASKPPYFDRVPIDHNIHELRNYKMQLSGTIHNIVQVEGYLDGGEVDHHVVAPARPSRDCSWKCDFFKICRMFDDGSRVEAAVESLYEVRDPLSYYQGREVHEAT